MDDDGNTLWSLSHIRVDNTLMMMATHYGHSHTLGLIIH